MQLLSRCDTHSLAPKAAGHRRLESFVPAIAGLDAELEDLGLLREHPGGRLRVTIGKHAADALVWRTFSRWMAAFFAILRQEGRERTGPSDGQDRQSIRLPTPGD